VITLGIAAVSTSSIFIRFAQEHTSSLVIAAYRLTIATVVIAPIVLIKHRAELQILTRKYVYLGILSGIFLALHFATWISSLEYTTVASSLVFVSTTPMWVAMLSPLTLKEPVKRAVLLGMLVALVGGVIVGLSDSCTIANGSIDCPEVRDLVTRDHFLGDVLALAGALLGAGYLLIGRKIRPEMSLFTYIFMVYGIAAIVLILIMLFAGQDPVGFPSKVYVWLILLALLPQLVGHSSFNWALRYLSAGYVSVMLLAEPIGSTILAYFILNETPSIIKIFGAILILIGIVVSSRGSMPD
jgi:drug/metabolite transporter (DMT)-like permease